MFLSLCDSHLERKFEKKIKVHTYFVNTFTEIYIHNISFERATIILLHQKVFKYFKIPLKIMVYETVFYDQKYFVLKKRLPHNCDEANVAILSALAIDISFSHFLKWPFQNSIVTRLKTLLRCCSPPPYLYLSIPLFSILTYTLLLQQNFTLLQPR